MGRQAEMGPTWAPTGVKSRQIAQILDWTGADEKLANDTLSLDFARKHPSENTMLPNIAQASSKPSGQFTSNSKPCLYYFPFAGRGELARLIASVGGLELDEKPTVADKASFGSPGTVPCLSHGALKISQSFAIESYLASVAPNFVNLTEAHRAKDCMLFKIKEDLLQACASILQGCMADERKKITAAQDVAKVCGKWLSTVETMLPVRGFIHGLDYPTAGDLAVLNMATGFMPFGAAYVLGGYDVFAKHKKFASHVDLVAEYPAVRQYLEASSSMLADPFGIRSPDAGANRAPTPDFFGLKVQQTGAGRAMTPSKPSSKSSARERPSVSFRNDDDLAVFLDDLPSARLDMSEEVNWQNSTAESNDGVNQAPDEYDQQNRQVWMCSPGDTTIHWRPTEQSLSRESYNDIIQKNKFTNKQKGTQEKFDVSEAMMKAASLSRQAQLGPDWLPSGLLTRSIAAHASAAVTGEPLGYFPGSSGASSAMSTPRNSRLGTAALTPRPPSCGQAPTRNRHVRKNLQLLGVVR